MSEQDKVRAVHDYIINLADYDTKGVESESISEESHSPYGILVDKTGVCDGYAETACLILDRIGIECIKVLGTADGIGHAWNIVKIDGKYYHMDITYDDPVWSDGRNTLEHDYFLLDDMEISKDHEWERDKYPECR
jgi:transglutaminase/protease-like cytokinesis protein 3